MGKYYGGPVMKGGTRRLDYSSDLGLWWLRKVSTLIQTLLGGSWGLSKQINN